MQPDDFQLVLESLRRKPADNIHEAFKVLMTCIPDCDDVQRISVLQHLSVLYHDRQFLSQFPQSRASIDALMDLVATHMADDFLFEAFGYSNNRSSGSFRSDTCSL